MDTTQAAIVIQKRFRMHKQNKTGDLTAEQKNFIKPWVKRWKAKSIFQVLLLYRAERLQVLANFCLQIHIFNQKAVNLIKRSNESVAEEEIDPTANPCQFLPPIQMPAPKIPFIREGFIQRANVESCEALPDCNLEALKSEITAEITKKMMKNRENLQRKEEETQTCFNENDITNLNYVEENVKNSVLEENNEAEILRDDKIMIESSDDLKKEEVPETDIVKNSFGNENKDVESKENHINEVEKVKNDEINGIGMNKSEKEKEDVEKKEEKENVEEQEKKEDAGKEEEKSKMLKVRPSSVKSRQNFTISIKELEEKFRGPQTDSENENTFNFRSMLRKTNYPLRRDIQEDENSVFENVPKFEFQEKRHSMSWDPSKRLQRRSDSIVTELAPGILIRGKVAEL